MDFRFDEYCRIFYIGIIIEILYGVNILDYVGLKFCISII